MGARERVWQESRSGSCALALSRPLLGPHFKRVGPFSAPSGAAHLWRSRTALCAIVLARRAQASAHSHKLNGPTPLVRARFATHANGVQAAHSSVLIGSSGGSKWPPPPPGARRMLGLAPAQKGRSSSSSLWGALWPANSMSMLRMVARPPARARRRRRQAILKHRPSIKSAACFSSCFLRIGRPARAARPAASLLARPKMFLLMFWRAFN